MIRPPLKCRPPELLNITMNFYLHVYGGNYFVYNQETLVKLLSYFWGWESLRILVRPIRKAENAKGKRTLIITALHYGRINADFNRSVYDIYFKRSYWKLKHDRWNFHFKHDAYYNNNTQRPPRARSAIPTTAMCGGSREIRSHTQPPKVLVRKLSKWPSPITRKGERLWFRN